MKSFSKLTFFELEACPVSINSQNPTHINVLTKENDLKIFM